MRQGRVSSMMGVVPLQRDGPWPGDLETLYETERLRFVRLAFLITGRRDVAEEMVQEAFIATAPRWENVEHPTAYVRTAVANRSRNWLRDRKTAAALTPPTVAHEYQNPDELWDALGRLNERRRVAVVLRYYEGPSDTEIGAVLHCRPATVRSLIHRAMNDLRQEIER